MGITVKASEVIDCDGVRYGRVKEKTKKLRYLVGVL